jgi:hypothetical protein
MSTRVLFFSLLRSDSTFHAPFPFQLFSFHAFRDLNRHSSILLEVPGLWAHYCSTVPRSAARRVSAVTGLGLDMYTLLLASRRQRLYTDAVRLSLGVTRMSMQRMSLCR